MMKSVHLIVVFLSVFGSADMSAADAKSWPASYVEAGELVKKQDLASAAVLYYRAQLASSWAKELRPSAFVSNGSDPGTFRAAINTVLGQSINPWAFKDSKKRLLPILKNLESEVGAITTEQELAQSIYSGALGSAEQEKAKNMLAKYPFTIPFGERLPRFKSFAAKWIKQGRAAAGG